MITISLTASSCQHKVNMSCTSVGCLDNKGCCDRCCDHIFIDHYFLSAQGQQVMHLNCLFRHQRMLQQMLTHTTAQNVMVLLELTLLLRMLRFYWNSHSHYCSECNGYIGTYNTAQNVKVLLELTLLLRM